MEEGGRGGERTNRFWLVTGPCTRPKLSHLIFIITIKLSIITLLLQVRKQAPKSYTTYFKYNGYYLKHPHPSFIAFLGCDLKAFPPIPRTSTEWLHCLKGKSKENQDTEISSSGMFRLKVGLMYVFEKEQKPLKRNKRVRYSSGF